MLALDRWECGHTLKLVQPEGANGSTENIIDRSTRDAALIVDGWIDEMLRALPLDGSAVAVRAAVDRTLGQADLGPLADLGVHSSMHGMMTGALDSQYEAASGDKIAPVEFEPPEETTTSLRGVHAEVRLAAKTKATRFPGFVDLPYRDAVDAFWNLKPVTRPAFDALEDKAKQNAFTVANATRKSVVRVVQREIARQVAKGADFRDFRDIAARRLERAGWTPKNPTHLENVFRTNVSRVYSAGRWEHSMRPSVRLLRPFVQIVTVNDGPPRQRPTHQALHLRVLRIDNPIWAIVCTPFGYMCFLPGTEIQGSIVGGSRAFYEGQAVELTTAEGRRLAVTANHPVLTARGLIPAQAVCESDQLVSYRGEPGVTPLGAGAERHEYNRPAAAEEVFRTLSKSGSRLYTKPAANEFHGEAKRFRGEVEVVGSYRHLLDELEASLSAHHGEMLFMHADPAAAARGHLLERLSGSGAPSRGIPRGSTLLFDQRAVGLDRSPLQPLRVGPASHLDAVLYQNPADGLPADAEFIRELFARFPGQVTLDQVRRVRKYDFSGHVYDLESETGWVVANGIMAGNCRCRTRTLPASYSGPVETTLPGVPDEGFVTGVGRLMSG